MKTISQTPEFKQLKITADNARAAWILAQQEFMELDSNQDITSEKYVAMLRAEDDFISKERELVGYMIDRIDEELSK